eukprot:544458-Pyramimonas_sp.AAC.1
MYDMSKYRLGTGVKSYEWLMSEIESLMLRDKEERNINVHESTLNQRAQQARLGGGGNNNNDNRRNASGKAAPAEATARFGKPTD